MPNEERKSGIGGWMKSHHLNWLAWILVALGVVFAIVMLARVSQ